MATKKQPDDKSLAELEAEVSELMARITEKKSTERKAVIERIREEIAYYELTAPMLFGRAKLGPAPVAYRDANGNTWAGRGKRPLWLVAALKAGRTLDEFKV